MVVCTQDLSIVINNALYALEISYSYYVMPHIAIEGRKMVPHKWRN